MTDIEYNGQKVKSLNIVPYSEFGNAGDGDNVYFEIELEDGEKKRLGLKGDCQV
ncbi:MAG: hypothetical protein KGJ90_06890 [Patescibacteria group bacterium]|nr:hypothetical protein [Patescibacteria group bacterium]